MPRSREVSAPVDREGPDWPRSFASFAGLSMASLALPFVFEMGLRLLLLPVVAAVVGGGVGVVVRGVLVRVHPRRRVAVGAVIAPVIAAVGGGTVAMFGAAIADPHAQSRIPLVMLVLTTWGSVVAWAQSTWFVPVVLVMQQQGGSISTAVLLGPVLVWVAGVLGLFVAMVVGGIAGGWVL